MERRDDIRAAIHNLLGTSEAEAPKPQTWRQWGSESGSPQDGAYTESQIVTLRAVQASLRAHHVEAEISDIVHALLEALATRPALCRGLVAAYLLGA